MLGRLSPQRWPVFSVADNAETLQGLYKQFLQKGRFELRRREGVSQLRDMYRREEKADALTRLVNGVSCSHAPGPAAQARTDRAGTASSGGKSCPAQLRV